MAYARDMGETPESGFICPHCDRRVFNRRLPECEFCDGELPSELLLSPEEQQRIDREAIERAERKRELEEIRQAALKEARRGRGGGGFMPMP